MRNSNKTQVIENILVNLSEPDTKWAVPVPGLGIIFGLTPNCEHGTTTEFVALDGKIVFRADQPSNMVKMHGRLWGLDSSFKPGTHNLLLGAAICPRGSQSAAIMRLRVVKGIRIPVGYLREDEVDKNILRAFHIKTLLAEGPIQGEATPTPPSNKRPAFIVADAPEPVKMVPVAQPKEFTKPVHIPGYFGRYRQPGSKRRNTGPAAPRKPLNSMPPIPHPMLEQLSTSMTKFKRHWVEAESTQQSLLSGVFGVTVG